MKANGKAFSPISGSPKKTRFTRKHPNEPGKQQMWEVCLVQVMPNQFGLLFPNQISQLFLVEVWEGTNCPLRKHTYLLLENDEWKIGLINEGRFDVQKDRFSVWLKDKVVRYWARE